VWPGKLIGNFSLSIIVNEDVSRLNIAYFAACGMEDGGSFE
jgi:hypothetical protein